MTENQIIPKPELSVIERALVTGDLASLKPEERVLYYKQVCESLGLNPLTRPFDYIVLNGKLTLYARKDATEQLRRIYGISLEIVSRERIDDVYIVTVRATDRAGRVDMATGAVSVAGLKGDALANAIMKAETKAKRRATLSIAGLGWMDETETETIPNARVVSEDYEERTPPPPALTAETNERPYPPEKLKQALYASAARKGAQDFDEKYRQQVAATLEYIFLSKDKRHDFIKWLTDGKTESMKDVDQALVAAMYRWLRPVYSPEQTAFIPTDPYASQEANTAWSDFMRAADGALS